MHLYYNIIPSSSKAFNWSCSVLDAEAIFSMCKFPTVVKPFNVLSQGDCTGDVDMITLVKEYIKKKYNKPGNV